MGNFDLFSDAADRTTFTHTRTSATTDGPATLNPEGTTFNLDPAPTTAFAPGMRVFVISPSFVGAFCTVKAVPSSTSVTLLPMQSAGDSVTMPHLFPDNSTILVVDEVAAQQVVDLSEAPDDAYDYLVVGCAAIESSASPGETDISMRLMAPQDDSVSGVSGYGASRVTLSAANPDRTNFVAASKVSLVGGQRYENFIVFNGPNTDGVVTSVGSPRLLALRVTGGYFAGDGKTATGNTTSTSLVDYLDLGANLPAGQYLVVCTWALGSTVLASQHTQAPATTNYISGGFMGVVTLGATNRVRLRYKGNGGSNANIRNAFLCAVPIANIPAFAAVHVSQDLATDYSASVGTTFTAAKTSGSVTLEAGRHIEVVAASLGGGAAFRARPNFGAGGTGLGNDNLPPFGTASDAYHSTFWFLRNRRVAGATTNAVEMRSQSGTNTLRARDFTFSWLREQPDFVAQPNEPIAVVADVELGGRVLKRWNSTTTTRRYSHRIDDQRAFSRVRVNSQQYTQVYSLGTLADGTWFWDALSMDLYVQLTTTHAAIGTPDSSGLHIVVVPLLLVGNEKYDLVDVRGVRWPYRPLLGKSLPQVTQSMRSDDAKFSTGASLGTIDISGAHGEFDDAIFRSSFDSYRCKIRRGFPRRSTRLDDFEVVGDAIIRKLSTDFENVQLQLVDRRRIMQTPVAKTKITVCEGYGSDARTRADQELPVFWGPTLGLVAYRITQNEGGTDWNEYRFVDHAVKSVSKVWIDAERSKAVAGTNPPLDASTTYTGNGRVRVRNDAFDEPTQPPNVVYVDFIGMTHDHTTSGRALQTIGAIARDLLVSDWTAAPATATGGTPATRLAERTFRMVDRRWRWQQITGGGRRPVAPVISFGVSGKTTVEEALTQLCAENAALWFVNHQDRIALDVPDFDRGNMARNGGFEDDANTAHPWKTISDGTLTLTTSRKYAGARSAEISNGSPANAAAAATQHLTLPSGGTYVVTLVASLLEGLASAFRIAVVGPSGVETLSEAQTVGTGRWTRHSLVYEAEPGDAGFAELRLYPAHGSTTATRIAVDEVELYRVINVGNRVRTMPLGIEFEDEHYHECDTPYAVNRASTVGVARRRIAEPEARGLSAALEPEGKYAVPSSKRAVLTDTHAHDGDSAAGLGSPIVLYYSRTRALMTIAVEGLDRIPLVGDYFYHRDNPRVPEATDGHPIWRVAKVETDDASGKRVVLEVRKHLDPVTDRVDIAPDNVPMGASALTLSPGSITDYSENTSLQRQFLMGARKPDMTTQRGDFFHKHSLEHRHTIPAHDHDVTPSSHGIDAVGAAGSEGWPVHHDGLYEYPAPVGPQEPVDVSRGLTDGGHSHNVPGTPVSSGSSSGQSSPPNATLETAPGPNEPSFHRTRMMQRTAHTVDTISADLIVGFRSLPLPAGWTRRWELDGMYIRCAGTLGAMATTTTGTFTPSDAGSTLPLTSGTGAILGRRLTVTKSGSTVHVIITVENGANPTVVPLHETSDVDNASFPTGGSATVTADSQLLVRTNVATSTYTPNDAGSTLTVASATNIGIGSLLTVINTDDANKYVHVLVAAVSGVDLTVFPLHLPGDQANTYSFAAGAGKVVMHSESLAPTHKHGGTMASHQHTGGGHEHSAASFILGFANNGLLAQKYLGGGTVDEIGDAAQNEHTHLASIRPPGDNTNSSSAGGSITGDVAPVLPFFELVFASSDGTQKTIPAGGVLFWTQSNDPPGGWSRIAAAKDLFVKGAATSAAPTTSSGGHTHTQSNTAHTMTHAHGTTAIQPSEEPASALVVIEQKAGAGFKSIASRHAHQVTATIESVNPGLSASSHVTGAALLGLPRHKTVMLISKN